MEWEHCRIALPEETLKDSIWDWFANKRKKQIAKNCSLVGKIRRLNAKIRRFSFPNGAKIRDWPLQFFEHRVAMCLQKNMGIVVSHVGVVIVRFFCMHGTDLISVAVQG